MKWYKLFLFLLLVHPCLLQDLLSKFNQKDYKIKDLRVQVADFDREYFFYFTAFTYKYNRTVAATNVSFCFRIEVEDKLEILVQVYKLYSGSFKTFPIRFQVSADSIFKANAVGIMSINKCGNIASAYFFKNVEYHACNFVVDESKFPPLIPTGVYKLDVWTLYLNKIIVHTEGFLEIARDALPKRKSKQ